MDDLDDSNEIDDLRRQYKRIFENIEKWLLKITNNEDGIKSLIRTVFQEKEFGEKTLFLQVVKEKLFLMSLEKYCRIVALFSILKIRLLLIKNHSSQPVYKKLPNSFFNMGSFFVLLELIITQHGRYSL